MNGKIHDRAEAGHLLAAKLAAYAGRDDVIVLGLPRGGVEVGNEIARELRVPLDIFLVRKLGVPNFPELAMGAIATCSIEILNSEVVEEFQLKPGDIEAALQAERVELKRREEAFRDGRPIPELRGRTVVLADDGIATGSTMRAAVQGIKKQGAARIIVAVGVAPLSTSMRLAAEADEGVYLLTPRDFRAVSLFFDSFPQLTDGDVCSLLREAWRRQVAGVDASHQPTSS
jgi:putative phosphoribosyl transferase